MLNETNEKNHFALIFFKQDVSSEARYGGNYENVVSTTCGKTQVDYITPFTMISTNMAQKG